MQASEAIVATATANGKAESREIPPLSSPEGRTDIANARRLASKFRDRLRFVAEWGHKPIIFDRRRWDIDTTGRVVSMAKAVSDDLWREARKCDDGEALKWAA